MEQNRIANTGDVKAINIKIQQVLISVFLTYKAIHARDKRRDNRCDENAGSGGIRGARNTGGARTDA